MPMSFPNMQSLKDRAMQRGFRTSNDGETTDQYRTAFANYMIKVDMVESMEIRSSKGWDQWSPEQGVQLMRDSGIPIDELIQDISNN